MDVRMFSSVNVYIRISISVRQCSCFFSWQVKKSILATDMISKNSSGPSGGSAKGHLAKGPASTIGSPPNPKIREAA